MRQVQESPTDYQEEYEYANPSRHCRDNVPQKTHLTEQHISKKSSVLKLGAEQFQVPLSRSFRRPLRRFQQRSFGICHGNTLILSPCCYPEVVFEESSRFRHPWHRFAAFVSLVCELSGPINT